MLPIDKRKAPIGVFDSGLGGLTVVKALMQHLPCEDLVYFGDTARVPYGTKSKGSIIRFSKENADILLQYRVKMIVVACNSSSSYALTTLKRAFPLPIVGVIDPGVQKALAVTVNKRIGVIATSATIRSQAYSKKLQGRDASVRVISQACPLFVPLVEEGWHQNEVTFSVARAYLMKLKEAKIDTLILGCTHYPLLKETIQEVIGKQITLIDSAQEVAMAVKSLLISKGLNHPGKHKPCYRFLSSDDPQHFRLSARKFLHYDIKKVKRCSP